jgi:hypothetical protein
MVRALLQVRGVMSSGEVHRLAGGNGYLTGRGWMIVRRLDGRMAFVPEGVPEGQDDSSQVRSAWNHEENSPVPAGRLNRSVGLIMTSTVPPGRGLSAPLPRHFVPGSGVWPFVTTCWGVSLGGVC